MPSFLTLQLIIVTSVLMLVNQLDCCALEGLCGTTTALFHPALTLTRAHGILDRPLDLGSASWLPPSMIVPDQRGLEMNH